MSVFSSPFNEPFHNPFGSPFNGPGVGGGAAPFDPSTLYAYGPVYNVQDLSTMWQESTKVTPAAVGQPVGAINDISGNGFHLSQATSGARGTLRQHAVSGKYYIECISGQCLFGAATFTGRIPMWSAAAVAITGEDSNSMVFGARKAGNQALPLIYTATSARILGGFIDPAVGLATPSTALASVSQGGITVGETLVTPLAVSAAINGGTEWPAVHTADGSFTMTLLRVGINTDSVGVTAGTNTTHFYGGFIANLAPSAGMRTAATSWLKSLCGISTLESRAYDIFAIGGQSNASGQGDYLTSTVVPFGNAVEYEEGFIKPLADPTRHYSTTAAGNVSNTGSLWPAFAAAYFTATGRRALIVGGGVSGVGVTTSIGWAVDATWCNALAAKALAAKAFIESKGGTATIRGVLWLGGETDATSAVAKATFKTGMGTLHNNLRTLLSNPNLPMYILSVDQTTDSGQDAAFSEIRDGLSEYAAADADAHLVLPYQGYETAGMLEDTIHWNQTALNAAGVIVGTNVAALIP